MPDIKLDALELQGLKQIQLGRVVEMHIKARLEELGLIKHKLGGWLLTEKGKLCLVKHG
jgi:hypothetical protein